MSFVHLHVQSSFSLLQGVCRVEELVRKARSCGMTALALTDDSGLYGIVPFYKACLAEGIRPVLGAQVMVAQQSGRGTTPFAVVLLAEDLNGYQNLIHLISLAHIEVRGQRPVVLLSELERHSLGLIGLSGGLWGEVNHWLALQEVHQARTAAERLADCFASGSFFLQVEALTSTLHGKLKNELRELSRTTGLPLVATHPVQMLEEEDAPLLQVLNGIHSGKRLTELPGVQEYRQHAFRHPDEMLSLFSDLPEALLNAEAIASRCRVELPLGEKYRLPVYPLAEGVSSIQYLQALCRKGAEKRYGQVTEPVSERLRYELDVIEKMGFADYFLIVWDFMRYAHQSGIVTGPGRGSVAGSLVAYVLGITQVDPLRFGLLFERFLNPERISLPDIDIDFSSERRDEVLHYVVKKYGPERVAQIATFGTLAARAVVRDVGRVLGTSAGKVDRLAKALPPQRDLSAALQSSHALKQWVEKDDELRQLFRIAQRLEGLPRHVSTHAAGVIISAEPLTVWVPLQNGAEGVPLTQFPMEDLEELGFMKVDFLSLRNLTIIEKSLRHIQQTHGKSPDLQRIGTEDEATYRLLSKGDAAGVFQLESEGMRKVLRELKPQNFEDIVAVLALFRPGPSKFIPRYIRAKEGKEEVSYPHPSLKPILQDTYGILVYQEQIMQVAAVMAGYSLGEADLLRRAVSKKDRELLDRERQNFVQGCLRQGHDEGTAERLYDLIVRFASYGFNRSHAVAYAVLAYQTAYLKTHYPQAFFAALMSESLSQTERFLSYVNELKERGIPLYPPDVQYSDWDVKPEREGLRLPLSLIKNVGRLVVEEVVQARAAGEFQDLFDFCRRVPSRHLNRRVLEALICSGAMDSLPGHRAQLLEVVDEALVRGDSRQKEKKEGQIGFADIASQEEVVYPDTEPFSREEMAEWEKKLLGFYLSGHPLDGFVPFLKTLGASSIGELEKRQGKVCLAALVQGVRNIRTKRGEMMAFIQLEDGTGKVDGVVFPHLYRSLQGELREGERLWIEGRVQVEDQLKLIVEALRPLQEVLDQEVEPRQRIYLRISREMESAERMEELKKLLQSYPGPCEVLLYYEGREEWLRLPQPYRVRPDAAFVMKIKDLFGPESLRL